MKIDSFRGEYEFLSNFWEAPVTWGGLTYGSNEAAFQAQKCLTAEEREAFTRLSPAAAKKRGRRVQLRPDWEAVKVGIMEELVRAKFTQHDDLKQKLLATGDAVLEEGNTWHDTCWGVDARTGRGRNHLGRILMKIRQELQAEEAARSGDGA
ncbi:MAG: NADAR family protein [Aristaeellaceae bacterium]